MGKARLVVVEDEIIVALDIRMHLERAGYPVVGLFSAAQEALAALDGLRAELVLMDIRLQGKIDGVEAAGIIRDRFDLPVVMLTAYADAETIERAKLTEPFGYIIKPFDERELKTTIEMALYRHELSRKLKESEERYRRFFDDDLSGDFVASPEGSIVECNLAFVDLLGYASVEEALGSNINRLFVSAEDRDGFWSELKAKRRLKLLETTLSTRQNGRKTVLANVIAYFDASDSLTEIKGYLIDTSEIKKLGRQLRESQKMEAVGRLAGGVAHDFNNLLTVILGYSSMIREKAAAGKPIDKDVDGIQNASDKATALTKQLLAFSKRQVLNPAIVDVNVLVRDLEKILLRLISEDITLHVYTEAERPEVFVDSVQVEQSLINLVANARDAMPSGGQLHIETRNVRLDSPSPSVTGDIPAGAYVKISVADTGIGIEPELVAKIFEPFFTTKGDERGTGLGLATVFGIVEQSEGYILVESEVGKGARFTLFFPLAAEEAEVACEPEAPKLSTRGNETILLVEDEEAVRTLVTKLLSLKGYRVHEAGNAGEALLICEQHRMEIDMLISDVVMPHIDGRGLALRLREIKPDLRILFMSGYPDQALRAKSLDLPESDFIQKPFDPNVFVNKVRSILDG